MNDEWNDKDKNKKSVTITAFLIASFISGLVVWFYFYPVTMYSAIFWVGAILMGLPLYVAAESLGTLGLSARWIKSHSRVFRISFGVFWVLACMIVFGTLIGLLTAMVASTS